MLGASAANYTDEQIGLCLDHAIAEIIAYCNREFSETDYWLSVCAERMTVIKLNRLNTEGLASQSMNGINESYIDGYPADIQAILKAKRRIKTL